MGMTIDELRDYVEEQRNLNNIPYHVYSTLIDELDLMADTMHKYQKIEQIMESDTYKGIFTYTDDTRLNHIREVLENGNDDN